MAKDYYKILGVSQAASKKDIETAYKRKAREYHPDLHSDNPLKHLAEEQMKEINEAYSVLKDPVKRREYDLRKSGRQEYRPYDYQPHHGDQYTGKRSTAEAEEWFRSDYGDSDRLNQLRNQIASLYNSGQFSQMIEALDEYLHLNPDDAGAHNLKGLGLMELNDYHASTYSFANAIMLAPNTAAYYFNSGIANHLAGYLEQSIKHFTKAVELEPNNTQYLIGLAAALRLSGQHIKARNVAQRARRINPYDPHVVEYYRSSDMREQMRREYYGRPGGYYCCPSIFDLACCAICCDCMVPGCGCFTLGI